MSEYGVITGSDTVRFERVLPGPIERVWAYLTESEKRGKWLAGGDMELRVGGRVELRFHHASLNAHAEPPPEQYKKYEAGHAHFGRVTQCDPPRLLSFIWDVEAPTSSEVTFALTPRGGDVLLVLTHRRLADRKALVDVSGGWHTHLGLLADNLAGVAPRPFWSTQGRFAAEYDGRIAKH
jgi:uncharacterized protein YndB with AHSA1/START domain